MKRLLTAVLVVALLAAPATAGTDEETFDKLVAKVAPRASDLLARFKPRVACACFEATPADPGFVVDDGTGAIRCGLPLFAADGTLLGISYCSVFEVLGR